MKQTNNQSIESIKQSIINFQCDPSVCLIARMFNQSNSEINDQTNNQSNDQAIKQAIDDDLSIKLWKSVDSMDQACHLQMHWILGSQSINQSSSQLTNQPIDQSIDKSNSSSRLLFPTFTPMYNGFLHSESDCLIDHLIAINQSNFFTSFSQPAVSTNQINKYYQSISQTNNDTIDQSNQSTVDQSNNESNNHLNHEMSDPPNDPITKTVDSTHLSIKQATSQTADQPTNQTTNAPQCACVSGWVDSAIVRLIELAWQEDEDPFLHVCFAPPINQSKCLVNQSSNIPCFHARFYQLNNQSIVQSTNQPKGHSNDQTTNQSINQSNFQSKLSDQSTNQSNNQSNNQSEDHCIVPVSLIPRRARRQSLREKYGLPPIHQSIIQSNSQSNNHSDQLLVHEVIRQSNCHTDHQSITISADHSIDQTCNQPNNQSQVETANQPLGGSINLSLSQYTISAAGGGSTHLNRELEEWKSATSHFQPNNQSNKQSNNQSNNNMFSHDQSNKQSKNPSVNQSFYQTIESDYWFVWVIDRKFGRKDKLWNFLLRSLSQSRNQIKLTVDGQKPVSSPW